jgi:hypothetical protein
MVGLQVKPGDEEAPPATVLEKGKGLQQEIVPGGDGIEETARVKVFVAGEMSAARR